MSIPTMANGITYTKNSKTSSFKHKHKIMIVGESHARNCANEVKQNVGNEFEVSRIVKPGASMEEIVNIVSRDIRKLTNKDILAVWIGTLDVAKNKTEKGLYQITFVEYQNQTNFIVMSVLHRHDLKYKSCVNDRGEEVKQKVKEDYESFQKCKCYRGGI
jgi:hypothetical protein